MKCNGSTNYNQPEKPNIVQAVAQASAHVLISFLININFKDQPSNFFCDILDTFVTFRYSRLLDLFGLQSPPLLYSPRFSALGPSPHAMLM